MLNMLKIDIYKAFRTTSFWVTSALVILISLLFSGMIFWGYSFSLENPELVDLTLASIPSFSQTLPAIFGSCVFLIGIFATMFATSDFTYGTIKNIASKGYKREYIYLSKFITIICVSIINIILSFITSFITAQIIIGNKIPDFFKFDNLFTQNILSLLLQTIAYISIAVLLSMSIRSLGPALATFLAFIFLKNTIITMINKFISDVIHSSFIINPYTITYAFEDNAHMLRGCIVVLIYIIVSTVAGMYIFRKRDIN